MAEVFATRFGSADLASRICSSNEAKLGAPLRQVGHPEASLAGARTASIRGAVARAPGIVLSLLS
jgi:hypothetical protein